MDSPTTTRPVTFAGIVLGIGLGGFLDGILFHQILQLHSMVSARFPKDTVTNLQINMFWDGMFHAVTWIVTVLGIVLLWRAHFVPNAVWIKRSFVGALFFGWGLFNFVEGILDHHVLHLHHVVGWQGESIFDGLFLLSGVIFMAGGWWAMRSARPRVMEK